MMSTAIFTSTSSLSSSSPKPSLYAISNSAVLNPKRVNIQHLKCIPQLGLGTFCPWRGLKNLGISISRHNAKIERKGKRKGRGVYASLFGVGAPEALVIGVVALLVFGPKGLAEVARNLGKTLRAFQPTIRELQEVSREFKSTLEREIGLDEVESPAKKSPPSTKTGDSELNPNGSPPEPEDPLAMQLRNTLAQLQKEQAEAESPAQEVTSEIPKMGNLEKKAIDEATSAVDGPQKPESGTVEEVASAVEGPQKPESGFVEEAASAVDPTSKPKSDERQQVVSTGTTPSKPEN